jgi:ribulose-phosphate 3-epimerase
MAQSGIQIAPSILSADFTDIGGALLKIESSGADLVQCAVMDGHFVPNLTFGPKMIKDLRARTKMRLDVHLMIETPEASVDQYIDAGANAVTFHFEACVHSHRLLTHIKSSKVDAGIAIVPSTPVHALSELARDVDIVLVMSVNPGFGGQKFIERSLEKIRQLCELREREGAHFKILVDGGVNRDTAPRIRQAGADVLISGNAFFSARDPREEVSALRA